MYPLQQIINSRIVIIDGVMGMTIRTYGMTEADIRGDRFRDSKKDLLNTAICSRLPSSGHDLWHTPPVVETGVDIVETNTFGATTIAQSEFFVDDPREHGGRTGRSF